MYLTLSVAGHLTIFLARTRGSLWSIRPARILLLAVLGTQALATLIAVYGVFMTPLGWGYAALVWGYAMVWFVLTDRIKLLGYRILDSVKRQDAVPARATATEPGPSARHARVATATSKVTPFHTDTDPGDPVYHDNSDCPYGREITRNGNDEPGADHRRRCDWCAHAVSPAA
jgi:H+-transporting ATPase